MNDWRPTASREALEQRAEAVRTVRAFFEARGMLEVDTPALSAYAPTDPNVHSLYTVVRGAGRRWLQTSPEFPMKRLLAAGYGDCWQLCRVFRDGESGSLHNPEFTMLEWYRVGWDDARLMDEVDALLRTVVSKPGPTTRITYADAFEQATGVALREADEACCAAIGARADISVPADLPLSAWHDLLHGALVIPSLGHDGPCFITDYPIAQAALARARPGQSAVASRFELVVDGVELANGYHELADVAEQRARFAADNAARIAGGVDAMPVDYPFLAALAHGLPDCAGVALGLDRMVMLATGAGNLSEVMAFR